jgi:ferredoxin-NADP reductase
MITPTTRPLAVVARRQLADDVVELELADPTGVPLPDWDAGAHVELALAPGLVRHYSLSGQPQQAGAWRIAVLHERNGRGGSAYVHEKLQLGATVETTGVRNHFPLEAAEHYEFIAGGIGVTPIIPMIDAAERAGASWRLTYGGRTRASMAYGDDLRTRFPDRVHLRPQDEFGLLDIPGLLAEPKPDTLVYCCGPEPLLRAVEKACESWPAGSLHTELFTAAPVDSGAEDREFEVELAGSGEVHTIPPGVSILDALDEAGVPVMGSCLEGVCGTCETAVLSGAIDHRDSYLTAQEKEAGDRMLICVSRAACPRLLLDL